MTTKRDQVLQLARRKRILRPRDLAEIGVSPEYLNRLHSDGYLDRPSRGIYVLPDAEPSEGHSLAEVATRVPKGVVCLLSALQFHELTTESPFEIWLAIGEKARAPKIDYPPLRIVRFSRESLFFGAHVHPIEGIAVLVTDPAKTVADCFKYRNKIGLDVAIEALRDCRKQRKATMDEIWSAAKVCRMTNVIRPYLETLS